MSRKALRSLLRDRRGIAALEFALVAPSMVLVLLGSIELTDMLSTNRRMEYASAALADVVSRDTDVSDDEIADMWSAAAALLYPRDDADLKVRITSVTIEDDDTATVAWSDGHNGLVAHDPGDSVEDLPEGLMIPGTTLIMTETEYVYKPFIGIVIDSGMKMTMEHREFRRPRNDSEVRRS